MLMVRLPAIVLGLLCALSTVKADVPSSRRSREAIARVVPSLKEALSSRGLRLGAPVFLRIFKKEMALELWVEKEPGSKYTLFRTYPVMNYGGKGYGPKLREGDGRAPEGFYKVRSSQMNPRSRYHLSFNLGYPNAYDRAYGRTGSALMVHGGYASIGCYAMTDPKIEEIYTLMNQALKEGQKEVKVQIFPFQMTGRNMKPFEQSIYRLFWENLREGYQLFQKTNRPPYVSFDPQKRRYFFRKS